MKTINELAEACNKAVKDYVTLKEEDNKLKADLKEIVVKNWQIVKSSVEDFEQIRKMLIKCFGRNNTGVGELSFTYENGISLSVKSVNSYWLERVHLSLHKEGRGVVDFIYGDRWNEINPLKDDEIPLWAEVLRTEEDANNVVEAISQYYIKIMEYYLEEVIPMENTKIRESIKNVKDLLSDSHTVEEKEDGTVEIRLGGKTYIGKVVEE
jgi:hypothetical protein